ncbi:hypothetical protein [Mucilaginibacter gilvus]|uniref:Lipoprotein n=1 Tax=Mucilaginibacter gilvus TaxID=2305909 RepID=A0A3S3X2J1_9SPHI|nr:hypothetical protein [Mucilaginibacter gilvus]RWY49109.1 hypothetical protein EPL05_16945 [Mucilaginibacter gilvus]
MLNKKILSLVCLFMLSGCYKMTEFSYLSITFNDSRINSIFLTKYVDSVVNKNLIIPDSINYIFLSGEPLKEQERIIHFKNNPDEWYMINFNAAPCWIETIYCKNLTDTLVNNRTLLGDKEIDRIANRFRTEVINQAEHYGRKQSLPDSILYDVPK